MIYVHGLYNLRKIIYVEKSIIPTTYSSEMRPKYISPAFSGHAHVRAYTWIVLNLMSSLNGAYPNRLRKREHAKLTTCADRLLDYHVVYISVTGKRLRSLIRKCFSKR